MVSIIMITIVALGAVAFLGLGGTDKIKAFGQSFGPGKKAGTATGSTLERETAQAGSEGIKTNIQSAVILRGGIQSKRNFQRPQMDVKTVSVSSSPSGVLPKRTAIARPVPPGSAQLSAGGITLTTNEISELRKKPFSSVEQQDLIRLSARFQRKSAGKQKIGTDPRELIFQKREQELISKKSLGVNKFVVSGGVRTRGGTLIEQKGGLFGKKNFATGGVSPTVFARQQADKAIIDKNIIANRERGERLESQGQVIQKVAGLSAKSQKLFLLSKGINLTGGPLNAKALAKLAERGLI